MSHCGYVHCALRGTLHLRCNVRYFMVKTYEFIQIHGRWLDSRSGTSASCNKTVRNADMATATVSSFLHYRVYTICGTLKISDLMFTDVILVNATQLTADLFLKAVPINFSFLLYFTT
jgi:hypothetical protein